MLDLCKLIFRTVIGLLRSRATLEAEILVVPTVNPILLCTENPDVVVMKSAKNGVRFDGSGEQFAMDARSAPKRILNTH